MIAYKINSLSDRDKHIYALVPPYKGRYSFVKTSYTYKFMEPETLVFACDNEGKIIDRCEITGIRDEAPKHTFLIENMGYSTILSMEEASGLRL